MATDVISFKNINERVISVVSFTQKLVAKRRRRRRSLREKKNQDKISKTKWGKTDFKGEERNRHINSLTGSPISID